MNNQPTTEEMNAVIAEIETLCDYGEIPSYEKVSVITMYEIHGELGNWYWEILMPVWQKLRHELTQLYTKNAFNKTGLDISMSMKDIRNAIANDCDITKSHQLIYEAIQWLNNNK